MPIGNATATAPPLGQMIAHVSYGLTTGTGNQVSINSSTFTAIDTTHLTIPSPGNFPASGLLIVQAFVPLILTTGTTASNSCIVNMTFLNHAGGAILTPTAEVASVKTTAAVAGVLQTTGVYCKSYAGTAGTAIPGLDLACVLSRVGTGSAFVEYDDGTNGSLGPIEMMIFNG
jgi:hypothetical protein